MKLRKIKELIEENKSTAGLVAAAGVVAAIGTLWSGIADLGMSNIAKNQHTMEAHRIYSSARPILRTKVDVEVLDDKEYGAKINYVVRVLNKSTEIRKPDVQAFGVIEFDCEQDGKQYKGLMPVKSLYRYSTTDNITGEIATVDAPDMMPKLVNIAKQGLAGRLRPFAFIFVSYEVVDHRETEIFVGPDSKRATAIPDEDAIETLKYLNHVLENWGAIEVDDIDLSTHLTACTASKDA